MPAALEDVESLMEEESGEPDRIPERPPQDRGGGCGPRQIHRSVGADARVEPLEDPRVVPEPAGSELGRRRGMADEPRLLPIEDDQRDPAGFEARPEGAPAGPFELLQHRGHRDGRLLRSVRSGRRKDRRQQREPHGFHASGDAEAQPGFRGVV
jgi:hypothetical protein